MYIDALHLLYKVLDGGPLGYSGLLWSVAV